MTRRSCYLCYILLSAALGRTSAAVDDDLTSLLNAAADDGPPADEDDAASLPARHSLPSHPVSYTVGAHANYAAAHSTSGQHLMRTHSSSVGSTAEVLEEDTSKKRKREDPAVAQACTGTDSAACTGAGTHCSWTGATCEANAPDDKAATAGAAAATPVAAKKPEYVKDHLDCDAITYAPKKSQCEHQKQKEISQGKRDADGTLAGTKEAVEAKEKKDKEEKEKEKKEACEKDPEGEDCPKSSTMDPDEAIKKPEEEDFGADNAMMACIIILVVLVGGGILYKNQQDKKNRDAEEAALLANGGMPPPGMQVDAMGNPIQPGQVDAMGNPIQPGFGGYGAAGQAGMMPPPAAGPNAGMEEMKWS